VPARFNAPNFYTGVDYATTAGDAWDFSGASDVSGTSQLNSIGYANGAMQFSTNIPYADPQIYINGNP